VLNGYKLQLNTGQGFRIMALVLFHLSFARFYYLQVQQGESGSNELETRDSSTFFYEE